MSNETEKILLPGLVDLQVNGFGGIDFNSPTLTSGEVEQATQLLLAEGTTSFFPTLITNHPDEISRLIKVVLSADDSRGSKIEGLHLEGPFISCHDGARGAHPKEYAVAPNWEWMERWQDQARGQISLVTISPEWPKSGEFISNCVAQGIKVAIGHSLATSEQIVKAVEAGATLSTHLGNGCPAKIDRHPNPIWEQLAQDQLWISVIGDGFHLPEQVIKVFSKVKKEKMIWVSDSTAFAGMKPGQYESHIGGEVILNSAGRLCMAEDESLLAGGAVSMLQIIENSWKNCWFSLEESWQMGSTRPLSYLEKSALDKDQVELQIDHKSKTLKILKVWKSGSLLWSREEGYNEL